DSSARVESHALGFPRNRSDSSDVQVKAPKKIERNAQSCIAVARHGLPAKVKLMPTKRILITGGGGFVGCNAARYFGGRNWDVTVLDNLSRAGADQNLL